MKRLLVIIIVGLEFMAGSLFSVRPTPLTSETLEKERFEIYFSPHLRSDTFLLDREVGTVYVLAKTLDDKMAWIKMVLRNPTEKTFTQMLIEGELPEEED